MEHDNYLIEMYKKICGVSKSNFNAYISNEEKAFSDLKTSLSKVGSELGGSSWNDDIKSYFDQTYDSYKELLNYCVNYNNDVIVPVANKTEELETKLKAYVTGSNLIESSNDPSASEKEKFYQKVFENMAEWFKSSDSFKTDFNKYYKAKSESSNDTTLLNVYDKIIGAFNEHEKGKNNGNGNRLLDTKTPEAERELFDMQNAIKEEVEKSFDPYYASINEEVKNLDIEDLALKCYECIRDINKLLGNDAEVSRLEGIISKIQSTIVTKTAYEEAVVSGIESVAGSGGADVTGLGTGAGGIAGAIVGGATGAGSGGSSGGAGGAAGGNGVVDKSQDEEEQKGQKTGSKIHFLSTGSSDSILIESNGHYGLVDTSNVVNDPYVNTSNHTVTHVVSYLNKLGVKQLDFIIATHNHSDHIGGVPEISNTFVNSNTRYYYRPYVTTMEDSRYPSWDNAGYAARAVAAASSHGAQMINVTGQKPTFNMGDFIIRLLNTETLSADEMENGIASGENKNAIVTLVTYKGACKTLLAADMEMEDEPKVGSEVGHVDILKLGHHGYNSATCVDFINKVTPNNIVITNSSIPASAGDTTSAILGYLQNVKGTVLYPTFNTADAVVFSYDDSGYHIQNPEAAYGKISYAPQGSWAKVNNLFWVYLRNGSLVHSEWIKENDKWYYLNKKGVMVTGWQELPWQGSVDWYYFDSSGAMVKGWQQLSWSKGTNWFYFSDSGAMLKNTSRNIDGKTYYFNSDGGKYGK